jgi:riboflavin kinase / FMN adenylyltransferase
MRFYPSLAEIDLGNIPSVLTVGMFDGIHSGHLSVLNKVIEISKQNNIPSIVLTFSNHPSSFFNSGATYSSLMTLEEKMEMMASLGIDILIAIPFDNYIASLSAYAFANQILVDLLHVSHIVFGYDNHFGQNREGSKAFIEINFPSIQTHRVPETIIFNNVVSSSLIKQQLQIGNVEHVTTLLHYPYHLSGEVIKGDQLGRTIGFPTANLKVNYVDKLIPAHGVYFTRIHLQGMIYYGMTNVGVRPTVTNSQELRIETHLLNFDADIYGENLIVEFLNRLRDEKKFESFPDLISQLKQDRTDSLKLLAQIHITT